ncbi:enoyl-CoA hydratase [Sphingobium sp. C100]|nr:enoyl-CoA hydratase [Sphingobium sp. C100]
MKGIIMSDQPSPFLSLAVEAGIAILSLDAPDELNAITMDRHRELEAVWHGLGEREDVRAIVLTGTGRAFSAGGDLRKMADDAGTVQGLRNALRLPRDGMRLIREMLAVPQPVVAAINGDAIGLGLTLALIADIGVVAEDAKLGDTHVKVGLVAGDGGAVIWPALVGMQRAKNFLLRGKLMSGAEAVANGLFAEALPREAVLDRAKTIAAEMAALPIWAVQLTKASLNKQIEQQLNLVLDTSLAFEAMTMVTQDYAEATRAFADRRKPVYKGY